jgi:carboxyl-terminal processing protease
MSKRLTVIAVSLLIAAGLVLSFSTGYFMGNQRMTNSESIGTLIQAWDIILDEYVENEGIDVDELAGAAIDGMLEVLDDPYSTYLDAEAYDLSQSGFEGQYEGIGAEVAVTDNQVVIIATFEGSPAAEVGILAGDIVLEIDGKETTGMTSTEVALLIRGAKGTVVELLVKHQDETEPELISLIRDEIEIDSVSLTMIDDIAYIAVDRFTERTNEELGEVLSEIEQQQAMGIILDLRGNPGGILSSVIDVASRFITDGEIISVVYNNGDEIIYKVNNQETTTELIMVVLVDSFSASGSEVLTGALQDNERAIIIGQTTFGKGSVNMLYELDNGSGIYLTIARWYTPDGNLIEGRGITPDYILELEGDELIDWAVDYIMINS